MTREQLEKAVVALSRARCVLVSTGAGMSRESGIPTFRDAQEGIWARFDPAELATEQGFRAAPDRVWRWYETRRRRMLECEPHAGHRALVELERHLPEMVIATQNIDGLHQRAGSTEVIELHGNIHRLKCLDQRHPYPGGVPDAEDPPPCPTCGSPLRPDVVWFGEMLPQDAMERAWALARRCDVLLVVGTSGLVWPVAELPRVARQAGATVVEVNPERSEITPLADLFLQGGAGTILPQLARALLDRHDT